MVLLEILWNDIFPLFVFIGCGWFLDSKFKLDISTYTKLTIYVVLPCFVFFSMYKYQPTPADLALLPAGLILLALSYVISQGISHFFTGNPIKRSDFSAVSTFSNAGHLGAALVVLVFSHAPFALSGETPCLDEAMGNMALLMILMNIAANTWGAALIRRDKESLKNLFLMILKAPVLYAALLAVLIRVSGFSLEGTFVYPVLHHFTGAFIVLTAVTTGVMIRRSHCFTVSKDILLPALVKLLVSPLLALGLLAVFPSMDDLAKEILLLFAAIPCAMDFSMVGTTSAQKSIFQRSLMTQMSLSILTLPLVIFLCRLFFPASM